MQRPAGGAPQEQGPEAISALFRQHYASVSRYVRRRTAAENVDDVVSDTFLVAWRRLDAVPRDDALPWLLGVARNVMATQRRGLRRREALRVRLMTTAEPDVVDRVEADAPVLAALATLREKDREALMLVAWDGLRPSEAAAVLGQSPQAFRVRLHRARRRLGSALERSHATGGHPSSPKELCS
jgi:RNA polymerase sigma-70 factor (ECF subfamily)